MTPEVNPFVSEIYLNGEPEEGFYKYHLYSDDLGDRYRVSNGGNKVDVCFFRGDKEYYSSFTPNRYPDRQYPVSGTYSRTIRFVDKKTGKPIENLNLELYNSRTNEVLYAWNTSKMPEMTFYGLKYEFKDAWDTNEQNTYYVRVADVSRENPQEYFFQNDKTGISHDINYDNVARLRLYQEQYIEGDIHIVEDFPMYYVEHTNYDYDEHIVTTTAPMFAVTTTTTAVTTTSTVEKTTAVTNKSELKYIFRWTTPPIMEYTVGDELDFSQGLILYQGTDENGDVVDYGHVPLFQLKTEHEPFTKPGDYEVKVYRQTNGEIALTYTVHVSEKSDTQPSATEPVSIGNGDANCDGQVTIADAAAILQYLGNNDKYPLSETGHRNADLDGNAGITTNDAIAVQKLVAQIKF